MKQKATHASLLLGTALLCALPLLSGCLPYPHRTVRSLEVTGTVLDARTRAPIKGAKVVQAQDTGPHPGKTRMVTTDASGRFVLPTSHNFHWAVSADGDVPERRYYEVVTISYPDYLAYEIKGWGDINVLLQPVQQLQVAGKVLNARTMTPIPGARVYLTGHRLGCTSDAAGHFRLTATPAFCEAYRASQASGEPFLDWLLVDCGDHGSVRLHCGERSEIREGNIVLQLEQ